LRGGEVDKRDNIQATLALGDHPDRERALLGFIAWTIASAGNDVAAVEIRGRCSLVGRHVAVGRVGPSALVWAALEKMRQRDHERTLALWCEAYRKGRVADAAAA